MSDVEFLKECLWRSGCYYISSELGDKTDYIRFTYEERNYVMYINSEKKVVVIQQIDSMYFGELDEDINSIMESVSLVLDYTSYNEYRLYTVSCAEVEQVEDGYLNRFEVIDENHKDFYADFIVKYDEIDGKVFESTSGLSCFDVRLFKDNWLEDFNENVKDISEEDLFLMISTLSSYFYKASNKLWEDEIIDPFVIHHALELCIKATDKYTINSSFDEWYSFWDEYFTEEEIQKHLESKNEKTKNKDKNNCI